MPSAEIIRLSPHCSLSGRGAVLFFASVCVPCLTVAVVCTARGFWPVLPFAGAELGLLAWVLHYSLRRRDLVQSVMLDEDSVTVESHFRGRDERVVFSRHWAQVKLRRADNTLHSSRLIIESHGRSTEVGSFLTDEERRQLAGRLKRLVGRVNESPPLGDVPAT